MPTPHLPPALMFQGTCSNAGKSVLTAAMCRILLRDGFRVAPFKAQNMSLNSFVTPDGRELGRAQATQAAACRLEPDARMNPVLLKPTSDVGSQVIVMGKPVGNMRVAEYLRYKPQAFARVTEAYASLAAEHEVMVLEGAGSPAEINLKSHDIVNMAMAAHAGAKVVLVGDIDRGGVFAALVGTMELLDPAERALVAGFVLNRFRGDASLLDPALDFTTRRTGKPFFGVVPHITDLGLPEEDSVSFKDAAQAGAATDAATGAGCLDVALIDLPHIANFTDCDALRQEPDVRLRVVRRARDLGAPDVVILPGSKNTAGDMAFLRTSGLDAAIGALARGGVCEVVGICGGFQMLGAHVSDPDAVETDRNAEQGLGLLPVATAMGADKVLTRVAGRHEPSGLPVRGYEIHHGVTTLLPGAPPTQVAVTGPDNASLGLGRADLPVWGTYLHGIFDSDAFRRHFLDTVRRRKGLAPVGVPTPFDLEPALDRLADVVRAHLDVPTLYKLLGLL
ncbi:MAG: cobyric acid synthase [Desulfovibrionaceae bacterium]